MKNMIEELGGFLPELMGSAVVLGSLWLFVSAIQKLGTAVITLYT